MKTSKQIRLPDETKRIAIIGRNGTGKTQAALWHLSKQAIDEMPWVIFDFKMDEHINAIKRAKHIPIGEVPSLPGVYAVHPLPSDTDAVTDYLWKLWQRENVGIYVDEGYMLADDPAFNAILTQGRSKRIPVILLSQRPVWISRFAFSEANFYQVFSLNDKRDRKTVSSFAPINFDNPLPDYHSYYYDVDRDNLVMFAPVPGEAAILEDIDEKLRRRRRKL